VLNGGGSRLSVVRERKAQRTRADLIDAAVELCLSVGYERTTVEMIAGEADVSTRTFSRYFASKDAVFLAVMDPVADDLVLEVSRQRCSSYRVRSPIRSFETLECRRFRDEGFNNQRQAWRRLVTCVGRDCRETIIYEHTASR
jgi:AcrR family transcriptional regulator